MPRPYHSPSSIELGKRCAHAWALRYISGLRTPENAYAPNMRPAFAAWQDQSKLDADARTRVLNRQRATGLGKAVHAVGEAWEQGRECDWRSLPGEIFLSGAHLVPHPDRVHAAHTEGPIGSVPLPPARALTAMCGSCGAAGGASCKAGCWTRSAPTHALDVGGVMWAGYRDLLVSAPGEFIRLGIDAPDGWALYDYKSTASIDRYALDAAGLLVDPQANLYAIDVCEKLGIFEVPVVWLYLETKRVRRAKATIVTLHYEQALSVVGPCVSLARELDTITRIEDAEKNPFACGDYGGCEYHVSAGGPCDARRSLGSLVQARIKKDDKHMALDPAVQARFDALKKAAGAPAADPPAEEPEAKATPSAPAPAVAKKPVGRPPGVAKKPVGLATAGAAAPAAGTLAETIAGLSAQLAEAEQLIAVATGSRDEILATMKAALE